MTLEAFLSTIIALSGLLLVAIRMLALGLSLPLLLIPTARRPGRSTSRRQ